MWAFENLKLWSNIPNVVLNFLSLAANQYNGTQLWQKMKQLR